MAKSNVETVLLKQLASCLAMPMFVIGPDGELVFFNESAEPVLGRRFDETGLMGADEWQPLIRNVSEAGVLQEGSQRPMFAAMASRKPTNGKFWLRGFDGQTRHIEGTAVPLLDLTGSLLGALGFLWELSADDEPVAPSSSASVGGRQRGLEMILARRLASKLAVPIFLIDVDGRLEYYNGAAEPILGKRFEEIGKTSREEMYGVFKPRHADGSPMEREEHPLWIARVTHVPVHRPIQISGLDGVSRVLEVTAIPLIGQSGRMHGVFGLFWEGDETSAVAAAGA